MSAAKRRGLGARDLDVLLGTPDSDSAPETGEALASIAVASIRPGQYQPRHHFDEAALEELAASIKAQGLIQPIVVRDVGRGQYELVAGERRWRAAKIAGLAEIPAVVRDIPAQSVLAVALIENIQREELTALEEAHALRRLIDEFRLSQQQAADAVGRSRAAVANLLRLLELPEAIRELLDEGRIDMGHARALLTLPAARAIALAEKAADKGWSVRELEQAVRLAQLPGSSGKAKARNADPDIASLERELSDKLGTRVEIAQGKGKRGKLVIHYHNADALEGILEKLR
ncbi:MAG: ParB/RepB/Spo0J family partition protein [Xanthomonadales bacterium]|nr:ParB/RepB/Spo0J family partition protein [Xanthomonadales bacterium]ODU91874.1 MAG: chromosome partitioning protein ParB [Rhodanobacter sp. SCN 66-43]OJY84824.1 MAG: chromosome partitioning protein ParB [Xanthomonadales bacterium 66-474]